mmetsp:Transcript_11536/g.27953  ORF Transcript_11536/g.27953 Transcript_11536/m.27953 type:complete len:279 (+) Transcript_11536:24-860(+)
MAGGRSLTAIFSPLLAVFLLACAALVAVQHAGRRHETELLAKQAATTQLRSLDTGGTAKVTWEQLRPEHVAYYPDRMYMYAGKETGIYGKMQRIGWMKGILSQGHPETEVKTFASLRNAALRAACWDESSHVLVFPSFEDYPDLHMIAKTDIKGYASAGNNVVFLGGFGSLDIMNEIFSWELTPVTYQEGPYYRSERNVHNTVFETMPSFIGAGSQDVHGVHMGSLPPNARSYYDSIGDSVVWSVRYDLGMVTYVGSSLQGSSGNAEWHRMLQAAVAI